MAAPTAPAALGGMSVTSAVANANAAAAAGAGKKAAQVALQAEINNDEEWAKFLLRDGLLGEFLLPTPEQPHNVASTLLAGMLTVDLEAIPNPCCQD